MQHVTFTKTPLTFSLFFIKIIIQLLERVCSYTLSFHKDFAKHTWACTGFDRDSEDGEAIRRQMRQIATLKLNANDNFELAAA